MENILNLVHKIYSNAGIIEIILNQSSNKLNLNWLQCTIWKQQSTYEENSHARELALADGARIPKMPSKGWVMLIYTQDQSII